MADPVINFNSPLLPPEPARKVTTHEPTITRKQKSPEAEAAIGEFGVANTAQAEALGRKAVAGEDIAYADESGAKQASFLEEQHVLDRAGAQSKFGVEIERLRGAETTRQAELERAGNIEPLLTGWKAVLAGVLQGFAQASHTMAGGTGEAPGVTAFNSAIARDRQMKIDRFKRSQEFLALARENRTLAETAMRAKLAEIDGNHIVAGNLLNKRLENVKSRFKTAEGRASADATQAQIQSANAEKMAKLQQEREATVTRTGASTTVSEQAPTGGAPTAAGALGAARAGIITDTLVDIMKGPRMSKQGLQQVILNRSRTKISDMAPIVEPLAALAGKTVAPPEGEMQGLSQSDRQSLTRQSVLNETVTYLTTGAAATKDEAASKTGQLRLEPSDDAATERTKLTNAYRYAKAAAKIGQASMTPEHLEKLHELGVALGVEKSAPATAAPAPSAPAPAAPKATTPKAAAPAVPGGVRKLVNGKPAMVYPDGTYEPL